MHLLLQKQDYNIAENIMSCICDCPDCNDGEILDTWTGGCENGRLEAVAYMAKAQRRRDFWIVVAVFAGALAICTMIAAVA